MDTFNVPMLAESSNTNYATEATSNHHHLQHQHQQQHSHQQQQQQLRRQQHRQMPITSVHCKRSMPVNWMEASP